ncbi:hypothetical protein Bca52824_032141 [Brassica carinata]|uniref:Uncharacterized protein n=1 Tax=Brassica carinata TaxID=52824 RepID=A0A8X7SDL0_BRACI|nr:hypothetical protein Bca52824_032141 [Brassica carinata]
MAVLDEIGEAVFVGFNDEMTKLTKIRASEAGPLLDGENPKDSQLPQFTHSRRATMVLEMRCLSTNVCVGSDEKEKEPTLEATSIVLITRTLRALHLPSSPRRHASHRLRRCNMWPY